MRLTPPSPSTAQLPSFQWCLGYLCTLQEVWSHPRIRRIRRSQHACSWSHLWRGESTPALHRVQWRVPTSLAHTRQCVPPLLQTTRRTLNRSVTQLYTDDAIPADPQSANKFKGYKPSSLSGHIPGFTGWVPHSKEQYVCKRRTRKGGTSMQAVVLTSFAPPQSDLECHMGALHSRAATETSLARRPGVT